MSLRLFWKNKYRLGTLSFKDEAPSAHREYREKYAAQDPELCASLYDRLLKSVQCTIMTNYTDFVPSSFAPHQLEIPYQTGKTFVLSLPARMANNRVSLFWFDETGKESLVEKYSSTSCFVPEQETEFVDEVMNRLGNHFV